MNRRRFLATSMSLTAAVGGLGQQVIAQSPIQNPAAALGRLKKIGIAGRALLGANLTLEEQCQRAQQVGITGFDFADIPGEWPTMKRHGIVCTMRRLSDPLAPAGARVGTGRPGWNEIGRTEAQGEFLKAFHAGIDESAASGVPNMILLNGQRRPDLSSEQGMDNTIAFCNAVKTHAEDKGVTLCMEFLNSKGLQSGIDSLFDHMAWGVEVVKRVNSPRVKILYDIYHAQIMEGFIVQTLRDNVQYIGHIHLGGVPGRHELDETQELNYHFIAQAIADLNFQGYLAHEWGASMGKDPFEMLKKSIAIMNV